MSGQVIGGVIGAVIGSFIPGVGTQLGWMIGSAIGGYVDPTQVFGPRLSDTRGQTSAVGGAIPRAWGTAPVPGNIIWQQPGVTEHKNTDDGKGSGTEQVTYTYTRSYAIMFHLGEIVGVLQIKRNGKIVYDARDDAALLAEYEAALGPLDSVEGYFDRLRAQRAMNNRWLSKCTIYNGTQTQEPDPTIEAYEGVGNVPAYRGRAYMVVTDDETQAGEIAQYEIVVCVDGSTDDGVMEGALSQGRVAAFTNTDWPLAGTEDQYDYTGYIGVTTVGGGTAVFHSAATIQEIVDYFTRSDYSTLSGGATGSRAPSVYLGWSASTSTSTIPGIGLSIDDFAVNQAVAQPDITDNYAVVLVYNDFVADAWLNDFAFTGQCGIGAGTVASKRGAVAKLFPTNPGGQYDLMLPCAGDDLYGLYPLCIRATRKRVAPLDGAAPEGGIPLPDSPGYYYVPGQGAVSSVNYEEAAGTFKVLAPTRHADPIDGRDQYTNYELGPALESSDPLYSDEAYWTAQYNEAVAAGDLPSGFTYSASGATGGNTYPWAISPVWLGQSLPYGTVTPIPVVLGTIVADICKLSGLSADEFDVSQLTDTLDGYVVARETDAASVIESLRPVGMFDPAEWDGKLRFIKRGGTAVGSINGDDLVERDGDAVEREMVQEVELLRKVSVGYLDSQAAWAPNTQPWERTVGTINARGESVVEVTAVLPPDQAATIAKRKGLTSWGEPEKQKFSLLSLRHAKYTPTDILNLTHNDAEVDTIRFMQIEDDSGIREIESSLNCAEAYSATATGVAPKPPTITDNSLRGPTNAVYMNLPSLRTQDNVPGVTIAACGYMDGWQGAAILLSVDGGVSYQQITTFTQPTAMGRLDASCTDASEPISVIMDQGSLSSITDAQLAQRHNAFAIVTNDVAELGQFKTATATDTDAYDLTENVRGQLGTTAVSHASGDPFVMVAAAQFIPLDISLAGRTLYFKAVTFGTSADAAEAVPFVFSPLFTSVTVSAITTGGETVTVDGQPIYVVTSNA